MAEEGLVQFLVLAKGAKGAACVALIQQVLTNKKLFVFGELLAMPNVQAVRFGGSQSKSAGSRCYTVRSW